MPSFPRASSHDRLRARYFLEEVRALIVQPESWLPGPDLAQDRTGAFVDPRDPRAVRWSAEGALRRAGRTVHGHTALIAVAALDDVVGGSFLIEHGTAEPSHAALLADIEAAIVALGAEDDDGLDAEPAAARPLLAPSRSALR